MAVAAGKSEPGVMEAWLEGEGAGVGTEALLHAATKAGKLEVVKTLLDRRTVAVDLKDEEGDTALHVAARCGQHEILQLLLAAGADLGEPNLARETPMALLGNLPADITEEILDSCISSERQGNTLSVTLTYPFLGPPDKTKEADSEKGEGNNKEEIVMTETKAATENAKEPVKSLPETNSLLFMIESSEHDHLLEHPLVNSFLRLKFASIAPFYMIKTLCYAVLLAFVNSYVFLLNKHIMEEGIPEETSAELAVKWVLILLLVLLGVFRILPNVTGVVKKIVADLSKLTKDQQDLEHVQKKAKPIESLTNIENLLLMGVLISSSLLVSLPWDVNRVRHLSAITVLTTWFGFLFHFGFHPNYGLYRNMFVTVSKNFFKFFNWFFLFIIAFAISFFFLFSMPGTDENSSYATMVLTLEKTMIMVFTGEIDYGDLLFTHQFGKFIFMLFIFFVMLVIMNLLNGLAISDIGVIQQESELNTQKSRMNYIIGYEEYLIDLPAFVRKIPGFKPVQLGNSLTNRAARFKQKGKKWTCEDVEMPAEVLDLVKVHVQNKALAEAEEKAKNLAEEGPAIKEVQERLSRIERVLENLTENVAKLK